MNDKDTVVAALKKNKFEIKNVTGNRITIIVDGDRLNVIDNLVNLLSNFGAKYNKNVSGSSIGGIVINKTIILIKNKGKSQ